MEHPIFFIKKNIKKIRMFTMPMFHKGYTPIFTIQNNGKAYNSGKKNTIVEGKGFDAVIDFDIDEGFIVEGDVQIIFYRMRIIRKKENIFKFWFNTFFLPQNGSFIIKKDMIDKACKDNNNSIYDEFFAVEINT